MFNILKKTKVKLSGKILNLKIYETSEDELYNIKEFSKNKKILIEKNLFLKKDLIIRNDDIEIELTDMEIFNYESYSSSLEAAKEGIIRDNPAEPLEDILDNFDGSFFVIEMIEKSFESSEFKVPKESFNNYEINTRSIDLSNITNGLIDYELFEEIFYEEKKVKKEKNSILSFLGLINEKILKKQIYIISIFDGMYSIEKKINF